MAITEKTLSIGTDPELILCSGDRIVKAEEFIRDEHKKAKFGLDGHKWTAELRPKFGYNPKDLVENIRDALATGVKNLGKFRWLAGPWQHEKPLGAHIHFGCPVSENIKEALDNQLGSLLALLEPPEQARMRRTITFPGATDRRPYGLLGDIRLPKSHEGFEWRTPGSFITTPGLTLGILAVSKAIVLEELEKGKSAWSKLSASIRRNLQIDAEKFYNADRKHFLPKFPELWNIIQNMGYFSKGREGAGLWTNVSYLKELITKHGGFDSNRDLKGRWGIKVEEKVTDKKAESKIITTPAELTGNEPIWWDRQMWRMVGENNPRDGIRALTIREVWSAI